MPWPPQPGLPDDTGPNHENLLRLRMFGCSGIYQRIEARSTGTLSDGTVRSDFDFYAVVTYASSNGTVGTVGNKEPCHRGTCRGFVAHRPGVSTLSATWFGGYADSLEIVVTDEEIPMVDLVVEETLGDNRTLHGVVNHTECLDVTVTYEDGTVLTLAEEGQLTSNWFPPSAVLAFTTSRPAAIGIVSEEGRTRLTSRASSAASKSSRLRFEAFASSASTASVSRLRGLGGMTRGEASQVCLVGSSGTHDEETLERVTRASEGERGSLSHEIALRLDAISRRRSGPSERGSL